MFIHVWEFHIVLIELKENIVTIRITLFFRTASGQRSFCYRALTLWNSLSNDLKLCESVNVFKRRLRSRLLSNLSNSAI